MKPIGADVKTIQVLIVDDEPLARLRISKYLALHHPELAVLQARDGLEAMEMIHQSHPQIVFLDIEMPGMTGIEMLDQLAHRPFRVIFQTAYNDFAIKAFDLSACDYILKPFTDERLEHALQRALQQRDQPDIPVGNLLDHLAKERHFIDRIAIGVGNKVKLIELEEILYFLSEQHQTRVFLAAIDFVYDQPLSFLESRLDPKFFQRIHRNAIVKLSAMASFRTGEVILKNGVHLAVSRERGKLLRELLLGKN